ncbi:uncharacterized protein LOC108097014 [Drosophila ficusphila]|uniref:uncharacterized protein LOC108097014 n=1 Tax=Drosophila ficusphila TaxID=30025 RepID=UPI0007E8745D|nr:uncharacterized protein LOC108097014 [Drosophila ficusphila]
MSSYTNLLRQQNVVDDCQRVSCNRGPATNLAGRCVLSQDIVLGCRMELGEPDLPFMLDPTWSVYLRAGHGGGDLSSLVRCVTFRMSPRLPLRLHVADSAPFEISEVLGSDFPVEVQVQYADARMSPTSYVFRPRVVREGHSGISEELHDKMIFINPPPAMRQSLSLPPVRPESPERLERPESRVEPKERGEEQVGDVARPSPPPATLPKKRLSVAGPRGSNPP